MQNKRNMCYYRAVSTTSMAEALDEVMAIQDRLRPFMQRTAQLLRDDPPLQAAVSNHTNFCYCFNVSWNYQNYL